MTELDPVNIESDQVEEPEMENVVEIPETSVALPKKSKFSFLEKKNQGKIKFNRRGVWGSSTQNKNEIMKDELRRYVKLLCSKENSVQHSGLTIIILGSRVKNSHSRVS